MKASCLGAVSNGLEARIAGMVQERLKRALQSHWPSFVCRRGKVKVELRFARALPHVCRTERGVVYATIDKEKALTPHSPRD